MKPSHDNTKVRRRILLLGALLVPVLFLTNCVHFACLVGVTCFPYIGPPKWYEDLQGQWYQQESEDRYLASLNALHKAVLDGNAAETAQILQQSPEQLQSRTSDGETVLDLAVTRPTPDAAIVRLLLEAGGNALLASTNDDASARTRKTTLGRAVDAGNPSPEIVGLLLRAGAEGFVPQRGEYTFQMPFGNAISRNRLDLVEIFLQSGKLDPRSPLAAEYLQDAVGNGAIFDRLLAYGIPLNNVHNLLEAIADKGSVELLQAVLKQRGNVVGEEGKSDAAKALSSAVYNCRFGIGNILLDAGAPIAGQGNSSPGASLVRILSEHCGSASGGKFVDGALRRVFVQKMVAKGVDLNAGDDRLPCPVWLGECELPREALIGDFLDLGADPYRLNPGQETPALGLALRSCAFSAPGGGHGDIITLMLSRPPKDSSTATRNGLSRALNEIFGALSCRDQMRLDAADQLIAYGAEVSALDGRGDTNLGTALFFKSDGEFAKAADYLLSKGMAVDAVDERGKTALYWMLDYDKPRMDRVLWLARHGARLENVMKMSPLPVSLRGPERERIVAQIASAAE